MDKFWYQVNYSNPNMHTIKCSRRCIQKYIDLYCPELFLVPEDITTENLQIFLEIILKYYQLYLFTQFELINLAESLFNYFDTAYIDEDGKRNFPSFSKTDRRELVLSILCDMGWSPSYVPDDIPFLIKCMNAPDDQIVDMHDCISNYFNQFDGYQRLEEAHNYFSLINQQRIEAIEKGQPLPIRPMGIELDPCYNKK